LSIVPEGADRPVLLEDTVAVLVGLGFVIDIAGAGPR